MFAVIAQRARNAMEPEARPGGMRSSSLTSSLADGVIGQKEHQFKQDGRTMKSKRSAKPDPLRDGDFESVPSARERR